MQTSIGTITAIDSVTRSDSPVTPEQEFSIGLYREHLEEASFLYEQRLFLLDDKGLSWRDLKNFEDRFEPHIDALVVGADPAIIVCKEQAIGGDFGELHAAVRVFCRQDRIDLLREVADAVDPADESIRNAFRHALADELPVSWQDALMQLFIDRHPLFRTVVPYVFGYRRIDCADALASYLTDAPTDELPVIARALGRMSDRNSADALFSLLDGSTDDTTLQTTGCALLRMHDYRCIPLIKAKSTEVQWPHILLGLCGGRYDVKVLHTIAVDNTTTDIILALGFLGSGKSIPALIRFLATNECTEAASYALHLITGAELIDEVFVPDEEDKSDTVDDAATAEHSDASGTIIHRLSWNIDRWTEWWEAHASAFKADVRYRNGKPFTLRSAIDTMISELLPRRLRQLAYEELTIRYGIDAAFETEMPVGWQQYSIEYLEEKVEAMEGEFAAGEWYCGGEGGVLNFINR